MTDMPVGSEIARPFLPSRDLELSKRFYEALGFQMVLDVDAWWAHVTRLDRRTRLGVRPPQAPAVQPWGLRVSYLTDPSGELWHIAQRRSGVVHD
jgi:uncharacterized glyoxalase superfamily protein PhnB